ncbi:MAG: hypothetical protein MR294_04790 [Bacteroidales bacterium]|nr:hypothetical protein [Bacteroidales bacterium]
MIKYGNIDYSNATIGDDGFYTANIDFYNSKPDLALSFGKAQVKFRIPDSGRTIISGFYDLYDFDPKQSGRSRVAEAITRTYGAISNGKAFNIYYNKPIYTTPIPFALCSVKL